MSSLPLKGFLGSIWSTNKIPFKWSISCWKAIASSSRTLYLTFLPSTSKPSTVTLAYLGIIPSTSRLTLKHPSPPPAKISSSEWETNLGLINI